MKKQIFTVTILDPSGASIEKKVRTESRKLAGDQAIELAKRTSSLPMQDRLYGEWKAVAVME